MRILLLAILIMLSSLLALTAEWVGYPSSAGTIFVRPGQERIARIVVDAATEELPRIMRFLDIDDIPLLQIYAYTDRVEFMRDVGPHLNLLGVSYRPGGLIRLDASGASRSMRAILAHELTHSILSQHLGIFSGNLPNWVNEGLAGFLSVDMNKAQMRGMAHASHLSGHLSLDAMEQAFMQRDGADAAYQQSRSMVAWLEWKYPGSLARLVKALAQGYSFPASLHIACHLTPERWLRAWQKGIPSYYYWLNVISSPLLYAPMSLLLIVLAMRRIMRRRQEASEEEEEVALVPQAPIYASPLTAFAAAHAHAPILDDIDTPESPQS